jgi:hypothetical protein
MLFGSTDDFAIEAMLEPNLKPGSAAWGRARIWCQGTELGDYSREYCTLGVLSERIRKLEGELDQLWSPELAQLSDLELINKLDGILYGYHGDVPVEDEYVDGRPWWKFNLLTNSGEMFDGIGKTFIFGPPGDAVFILHRQGTAIRRLTTTRAAVRAAAKAFTQWYAVENHKLNGAPLPKPTGP